MNATTTTTLDSSTQLPAAPPQQDPARCHHHFGNGKRCRFPASHSHAGFCPRHFHPTVPQTPNDATDLSADLLLSGPSEFSSADELRQFLARLLVLVTRGGISARRAAVLAYITNQLLHSHRAIKHEAAAPASECAPGRIIIDMPGPTRD